MVDDWMRGGLVEPFQGEGRASTIAQKSLQTRPNLAGNAYRRIKREAAAVPAEHVAGIIGIEQAANAAHAGIEVLKQAIRASIPTI